MLDGFYNPLVWWYIKIMSGLKESQHLQIPLRDIKLATNNFETFIGKGGFGWVYKGELSISGKPTTVAIKRLDEKFGQGLKEFLTEIQLLSGQKHQNLISLIGYCEEGNEKIIVYEYAARGSLDRYLSTNTPYNLTWLERLKICVGAACGLDHLHNHVGEHHRIIHRDIKSSNILLDENWEPRISDFGLSKFSLANVNISAVISRPCGTKAYCDPEYINTGILTKESDVYSFGLVLFEVLCGKLCFVDYHGDWLFSAKLVKRYYEDKKLEEIIDANLREQMSSRSMDTFSAIAYRCVQDDRGQRPPMGLVIEKLKLAWKFQCTFPDNEDLTANSPILPSTSCSNEDFTMNASLTPLSEEEQHLNNTLAAARIQAAFRQHSSTRRMKEFEFSSTEDEAAMKIQHAFRNHKRKKQMQSAAFKRYRFRTWNVRKEFLNMRSQV